jgi:hypothetical protein
LRLIEGVIPHFLSTLLKLSLAYSTPATKTCHWGPRNWLPRSL